MFARHADRPAWRPARVPWASAHATSVAAHSPDLGSEMRNRRIMPGYVHMFVRIPSAGPRTVRTHVLTDNSTFAHTQSAQCALPGPLVSAARGRLRRRLGGRPGRARPGRRARVGACTPRTTTTTATPRARRSRLAGRTTRQTSARLLPSSSPPCITSSTPRAPTRAVVGTQTRRAARAVSTDLSVSAQPITATTQSPTRTGRPQATRV
jgi:hypothetical protein